MSLTQLIKNQTIRIDAHRRGTGQPNDYNDPTSDIHIHKQRRYDPNTYVIRIPLQVNRNISVECTKIFEHVPSEIVREIRKVLNNIDVRQKLYKEIFKELGQYQWTWNEIEAKAIIGRITAAFGLEPNGTDIKEVGKFFVSQITDEKRIYQVVLNYEKQYVYIGECLKGWEPENLNF